MENQKDLTHIHTSHSERLTHNSLLSTCLVFYSLLSPLIHIQLQNKATNLVTFALGRLAKGDACGDCDVSDTCYASDVSDASDVSNVSNESWGESNCRY